MDEAPIVITVPLLFDASRARDVGEQLRSALRRRSVVIADLTQTWAFDSAGLDELCLAHEAAESAGRELRVVVGSAAILRQLARADFDLPLRIYQSMSLACEPLAGRRN